MDYKMNIAGLDRALPLCKLNDELMIGAFVIFGDAELTVACAAELLKVAPEYDYLITAEAKGIPLIHEMARQHGDKKYFLARKGVKLYMTGVFESSVDSITTAKKQTLYLDTADAEMMRGKKILIVDDVISTGVSARDRASGRAGRRRDLRPYGDPGRGRRAGARRHHLPREAAAVPRGRHPDRISAESAVKFVLRTSEIRLRV